MPRAVILLGLGLGLSLAAVPATPCQSATTEAQAEAIKKLPRDLDNLLEGAFYCQGVSGEAPYAEAKATTLSILGELTDTAAAQRFVSDREKTYEAGCPKAERDYCWAGFLAMAGYTGTTVVDAVDECDFEYQLTMSAVVLTLQTIRGVPATQ